jgi:hypothetical protein
MPRARAYTALLRYSVALPAAPHNATLRGLGDVKQEGKKEEEKIRHPVSL